MAEFRKKMGFWDCVENCGCKAKGDGCRQRGFAVRLLISAVTIYGKPVGLGFAWQIII